jgi:DNA repair protein RadC
MLIADLPVRERPRERLAALGAAALADRELLAVLLGTGGAQGVGAHNLAERLLARFGSVSALARAHPADLASVTGVGPAKAAVLVAAFELARRTTVNEAPVTITDAADIVTVAAPLLRGRTRERLVVVICDRLSRVIGCDVLSEGSADRSLLPVREAMVAVLRRDGKTFALAHNHPSGDPTPSHDDIEATRHVREAALAVGLRLLSHVVVTETGWRLVPGAGLSSRPAGGRATGSPTPAGHRVTAMLRRRRAARPASPRSAVPPGSSASGG